jgi:hypothetical protein
MPRGKIPASQMAPGLAERAVITIGAEAGNVIKVTVQLKGSRNRNLAQRAAVGFYLSDDAHGDSTTATAPSSGIAVATNGVMQEFIADKAGRLVSEANGLIDINFSEAGVATWYLVLVLGDGSLVVSGAITFA